MKAANSKKDGHVLVVGGSGGLGSAIVTRLADDWSDVTLTYRSNKNKAEALVDTISTQTRAEAKCLDLESPDDIAALMQHLGDNDTPLKAIVFASGVHIAQPYVSQISRSEWAKVIQVELMGFISLIEHALPVLRQSGGASIVNIGSFATRWYPPGDALSAVPKAGTEMLCRAIAKEEGRFGIRANTVAPGIIEAGLGSELMDTILTPEIWQQQKKRVPLKRFGAAQDIANAAAFLCDDQSSYITGQTLIVDGGLSL